MTFTPFLFIIVALATNLVYVTHARSQSLSALGELMQNNNTGNARNRQNAFCHNDINSCTEISGVCFSNENLNTNPTTCQSDEEACTCLEDCDGPKPCMDEFPTEKTFCRTTQYGYGICLSCSAYRESVSADEIIGDDTCREDCLGTGCPSDLLTCASTSSVTFEECENSNPDGTCDCIPSCLTDGCTLGEKCVQSLDTNEECSSIDTSCTCASTRDDCLVNPCSFGQTCVAGFDSTRPCESSDSSCLCVANCYADRCPTGEKCVRSGTTDENCTEADTSCQCEIDRTDCLTNNCPSGQKCVDTDSLSSSCISSDSTCTCVPECFAEGCSPSDWVCVDSFSLPCFQSASSCTCIEPPSPSPSRTPRPSESSAPMDCRVNGCPAGQECLDTVYKITCYSFDPECDCFSSSVSPVGVKPSQSAVPQDCRFNGCDSESVCENDEFGYICTPSDTVSVSCSCVTQKPDDGAPGDADDPDGSGDDGDDPGSGGDDGSDGSDSGEDTGTLSTGAKAGIGGGIAAAAIGISIFVAVKVFGVGVAAGAAGAGAAAAGAGAGAAGGGAAGGGAGGTAAAAGEGATAQGIAAAAGEMAAEQAPEQGVKMLFKGIFRWFRRRRNQEQRNVEEGSARPTR